MTNNENGKVKKHSIIVEDRSRITLTGVIDVKTFDELEVCMETELGGLLLKGKNLLVKDLSLEKGQVSIEGNVDGMIYTKTAAPKIKEPLVKRLLS